MKHAMKHSTILKTLPLFAAMIAGSKTMALGDNLAPVAVDDQFYVNRSDYFLTDVIACTGPVAATLNCAIGADTPAILVNGLYTGPASPEVACGAQSGINASDVKTVVSSQFFGEIFHSVVNGSETPVSLADMENSGPASDVVRIGVADYVGLLGGGTYRGHDMAWYAQNDRILLVGGDVSLAPPGNALNVFFVCPTIIHGDLTIDADAGQCSTMLISKFLYVTGDAKVEKLALAEGGSLAVAGGLTVTETVSGSSMGATVTFTIGAKMLADGETPLEYTCPLTELFYQHSRWGFDHDPDDPEALLTIDVRSMIQTARSAAENSMTLYYDNGTETVAVGMVGATLVDGTAVSLNAGYRFNETGQVVSEGNGEVIGDSALSFGVEPRGTAFSVSPRFSYRIWDNDATENKRSDAATVTIAVASAIVGGGEDDTIVAIGDDSGNIIVADLGGEITEPPPERPPDPYGNPSGGGVGEGEEEKSVIVTFAAKPGSDIVDGGGGDDFIFGDAGIVSLANWVAIATGTSAGAVTDEEVLLYIYEHPDVVAETDADVLRYISEHPDVVAGWPGADNSQPDSNTGESLDKADVLVGNDGNDIVFAQGGDDLLFGDASLDAVADKLDLSGGQVTVENVAVKTAAMYIAQLKSLLATLEGNDDGNDLLFGGDGDDMIFGLGGDDEMHGGSGNDTLLGGGGDDALVGGDGGDYLDGGDGADMVDGGAGPDIIRYEAADTIDGGDGVDTLIGDTGDGSLASLTNLRNVEIFLKAESDGDSLDLTGISKLQSTAKLNFSDDGSEVELGDDWQFVGRENGITTLTLSIDGQTLTLETTMEYEDGKLVILQPAAPYLDPVAQTTNICERFTPYAGENTLVSGWYVVTGAVTNDARIVVSGDVNLILCDGAELVAKKGVNVAVANNTTNSLTVWAQSDGEGMGSLTATQAGVSQYQSAIGGDAGQQGGKVVINGGRVSATGLGAGIGGGDGGSVTTDNGVGVSGFNDFQLNGDSTRISNGEIQLSPAQSTKGGTAFWRKRVNVMRPWRVFFTYKTVNLPSNPANGFAFFLHNDARKLSAQGDKGSSLCASGITPSVGTAYNIYGDDSAGWIRDGATTGMSVALGGISIQDGMDVCVTYDGEGRIVQHLFSDGCYVAFTNDVNLAAALGATTAWLGFSGATGSAVCDQRITNFRFWQADAKGSAPDITASNDASKWRLNGTAVYESFNNAPAFRITDMSNSTSGLVTRLERVYVGGPFKVHGTYHVTGNTANDNNMADGIAIFFHSQSPTAIGAVGSARGVLGNSALPSATGWMINIYFTPDITPLKNGVKGSSVTALNGIDPKTKVPVDFTLSYVPGRLSFTLEQDGKTATASQNVDLAQTFGDKFAYFSISGGTGGSNARQYVYNLSMETVNEGGGTVVVNGGTVTAIGNSYGIEAGDGSVTINGGTVIATGADGIYARCGITLGWTKPADRITASSFSSGGGVTVKAGQPFADERLNLYEGTLDIDALVAVRNKTLRPYIPRPSFTDPEGNEIEDAAVIDWLAENGFTQDDIDGLGKNAAATAKLYECYLLNCSITAQDPGGALSLTDIAVGTNEVSVTVQLVRQSPLGAIHGFLDFYGANDLADGFDSFPIVDTSVDFGADDPTFATAPTTDSVTQTATATLRSISYKFFKAAIHAGIVGNGEEP